MVKLKDFSLKNSLFGIINNTTVVLLNISHVRISFTDSQKLEPTCTV